MANRLSHMPWTVYCALREHGIDPFAPAYHFSVYQGFVEELSSTRVRGKRIFLGSMGDVGCDALFRATTRLGEGYRVLGSPVSPESCVDTAYILERLGVVGRLCDAAGHTCLVLTKNPVVFALRSLGPWPNSLHIGTSVDSVNDETRKRVAALACVVARVRWLSIEPLLDPKFNMDALCDGFRPDWVVVGGLSGRAEIPYECIRAALGIGDWCAGHNIPVYYKDNIALQYQGVVWRKEFPGGTR
jgi:hypothetical protein